MIKWIEQIEFAETHETMGKVYGSKYIDDVYFDLLANT